MPTWHFDDHPFEDQGREYLDQFDSLDMDEKIDRRVGVFVLDEYFRQSMADVGREYFNLAGGVKRDSVSRLWRKTLNRLMLMDSFEEPEYSSHIEQVQEFRNQTAHNTDYDPPQSNLKDIRDDAIDWLRWLLDHAHQYETAHTQTAPRELMIEMTKRSLDRMLAEDDMPEDVGDRLEGLQMEAERLRDELEAVEDVEDEITVELIDLLVETMELAQSFEHLQRMENEFWRQVDIEIDERRLQRNEG